MLDDRNASISAPVLCCTQILRNPFRDHLNQMLNDLGFGFKQLSGREGIIRRKAGASSLCDPEPWLFIEKVVAG